MKLVVIFYVSFIDTIFGVNFHNYNDVKTYLQEFIVEIENQIENLDELFNDLNTDIPSIRSKYSGFDYEDVENVRFFDVDKQLEYLKLFQVFIDLIHKEEIAEPKIMARLGQGFVMYNELVEAIENDANKILKSSSYSILSHPSIEEKEAAVYLKMVLKLFTDEQFYSEDALTRHGIQSAVSKISSKC